MKFWVKAKLECDKCGKLVKGTVPLELKNCVPGVVVGFPRTEEGGAYNSMDGAVFYCEGCLPPEKRTARPRQDAGGPTPTQ